MEAFNETGIDHIGGESTCSISTGERAVKNRLAKLAETHPGEVELVAENPDGSVFYHIPWKWIAIRPPKKMNLTDEQRKATADRLRAYRETTAVPRDF